MKKAFLLLCMVAGLVSCAKEASEQENMPQTGIPMTFNVTVLETKAAKTGWADGDKIYVFFNGLETKYLILERSSGGGPERWPDLPDSIDDDSAIEPVSHRTTGKEVDDQMHQSGFYWS